MNLSVTKQETWMQFILEGITQEQRQETDRCNGFYESPSLTTTYIAPALESDLDSSQGFSLARPLLTLTFFAPRFSIPC